MYAIAFIACVSTSQFWSNEFNCLPSRHLYFLVVDCRGVPNVVVHEFRMNDCRNLAAWLILNHTTDSYF